ncbi:MAG: valine--tRNA ligase [Pseudomonadota bacterium]
MDKNFDAAAAEPRIYAKWDQEGRFAAAANASREESYCIVIPPPNVTGSLHMGHALNNTLQDILIRWKRMQGYDVLWQPGTDHAGIATQMVVERELMETQQPGRREMGREKFVDRVWEQKEKSEGTILGQLKRLGCSCDWSRNEFTMSDGLSAAVLKVFVDLYNKGLIYRGKRLVNWDPKFETAISDLEVEPKEVDGFMWHFKYPLAGGETYEYVEKDEDGTVTLRETRDYISIATTRPETMLGDGAVAVHPSDERYAPIVGKLCEIPVGPKEHRRLIPIITDDYPDPDFGSGAVKITGAHDFNDYGVAKRGGIPCYRLMAMDASMRADGAPYAEEAAKAQKIVEGQSFTEEEIDAINLVPEAYRGLNRYAARARVIADITAEGLAVMVPADHPEVAWMKGEAPEWKENGRAAFPPAAEGEDAEATGPATLPMVESKKIMQPHGDRSGVVIEPMLTDQWFVDAEKLAQRAIEAVRSGKTKFVPENWEKTYYNWMENIEPWCISRQLWWGHQVPVWYGPNPKGLELMGQHLKLMRQSIAQPDNERLRALYIESGHRVSEKTAWFDGSERVRICAVSENEALIQAAEIYGKEYYVKLAENDQGGFHPDAARGMAQTSGLYWQDENDDLVGLSLVRDPDVLDTWFSSALWPFSTLGWPEKTPELGRYYKTDVLITGFDIIFFWVARMMMQGIEFMGEVPFDDVYINSIVVDQKGQKMSKSKGNVMDPLYLIDEYGADALRYALASQEVQGRRTLRMGPEVTQGGQRFGTKLWNAARLAQMREAYAVPPSKAPPAASLTVNKWIIGETARAAVQVTEALEKYRFNEASSALYDHIWKVFCDWYVEFSKPYLEGADGPEKDETRACMAWALDQCLVLLHPIMPFITEELWGTLAPRDTPLIHADWPDLDAAALADADADREIGWVIRLIDGIRSVRAEMNVPAGAQIELVLTGHSPEVAHRMLRNSQLIQRLARLSECAVAEHAPEGSVTIALDDCAANLPLKGVIDVAQEKARLQKTLGKSEKEIKGLQGKLSNQGFLAKAPEEVIEEQRDRLAIAEAEAARLSQALERLAGLA